VVAQVNNVFSQSRSVWMLQMDAMQVHLDPFLNGMASLPDTDLTTLVMHTT
jgi:hypothetical protein